MSENSARTLPGLLNDEQVLIRISEELADRFKGVFAAETVERYVFESYTALGRTARVTAHLPNLTAHFARDRLTALAQSKGRAPKVVPEVLFVCVHNAGRSQMAAALLEQRSQGRVHSRSAGSTPAAELEPSVVEAMAEIGISLEDAFPKPLTDDVVRAADVVVTMGCGDACPIYSGKRYVDWQVGDPAGQDLEAARAIRDDIDARVQKLVKEILDR